MLSLNLLNYKDQYVFFSPILFELITQLLFLFFQSILLLLYISCFDCTYYRLM